MQATVKDLEAKLEAMTSTNRGLQRKLLQQDVSACVNNSIKQVSNIENLHSLHSQHFVLRRHNDQDGYPEFGAV